MAQLFAGAHASPFRSVPKELELGVRDELLGRAPRFIAMVAYVPQELRADVRRRFETDAEAALAPFLSSNTYSRGIPDDPRFKARYHFAGAWRRHDGYYLVLYEF